MVLWAERAVSVPKKLEALIWAASGITVLNVTLMLFTVWTSENADPGPVWIDPTEVRIATLFDQDAQPSGFKYVNQDETTICYPIGVETYTCQRQPN